MTITNANIFSQAYNSTKDFLNGISGLDSRNRFKANYIHASLPNINQKGFDGYPFIVVRVDASEENKSFDSSTSTKVFRMIIGIYSDDPSQVDSMSDKIMSNLKDETQLTDFKAKELSSSPMAWDLDLKGKKISFRNIGIIARLRV